ncbi:MAG: hypothetical protein JWO42_673 [Chloroflexi bacterium]|nr:hypothetical protein [Chloroflexota bacterium]
MASTEGSLGGVSAAKTGDGETRQPRKRRGEQEHVYMPDELLLTFVDTTARPRRDDARVQHLLQRSTALAGDIDIQIVEPPARQGDEVRHPHLAGVPLTLRVRATKPEGAKARRDHIKEAADKINANLHNLQHEGIVVSSATPNWIISSSKGSGAGVGGPGTLPDPAPAGGWPIKVPAMGAWTDTMPIAPDERVVVAVLDSFPGRHDLQAAAKRAQFQDNALLQDIAKDGVITDWNRFTPPNDVPSKRQTNEADHGLFVAGVIHRIAPPAEIHLLHILDDAGVGHTHLLFEALDYCLALTHSGRRVVVNMSMYLCIPPGTDLWDHWFEGTRAPAGVTSGHRANLLEALDEGVHQRVALLLDAGAVIVAAAGNDALTGRTRSVRANGLHPQPRLPADYDGVICVVATNREGKIAAYSNRADIPPTGNCVATYGGQGDLDHKHNVAVVPAGGDPRDGMVGLFTHTEVPSADGPGKPNTSGWVYWSGTSFATPVISGIAANVLARNELARKADPRVPRMTPRQVMTSILDMAEPPATTDPALGCPYVAVTQTQ